MNGWPNRRNKASCSYFLKCERGLSRIEKKIILYVKPSTNTAISYTEKTYPWYRFVTLYPLRDNFLMIFFSSHRDLNDNKFTSISSNLLSGLGNLTYL